MDILDHPDGLRATPLLQLNERISLADTTGQTAAAAVPETPFKKVGSVRPLCRRGTCRLTAETS